MAHIIEYRYDDHFAAWFGAIDLNCSMEELLQLSWHDVFVRLDDGRVGNARVVKGRDEVVEVQGASLEVGATRLLYIVGISHLRIPPAPNESAPMR